MRRTVVLLAALAFGARTAAACALPQEKAAFDIAWVRSDMMLTALTCSVDHKYNEFITRFRPVLIADDAAVIGYFRRIYGANVAQSWHDRYVTSLANKQSELSVAEGSRFCARHIIELDQILRLHSVAQLTTLAAGLAYAQPISLPVCDAAAQSKSKPAG
ncbi:MAG: hypothetical protein ACP5NI_04060 [Acetobacteraceae bacterium]